MPHPGYFGPAWRPRGGTRQALLSGVAMAKNWGEQKEKEGLFHRPVLALSPPLLPPLSAQQDSTHTLLLHCTGQRLWALAGAGLGAVVWRASQTINLWFLMVSTTDHCWAKQPKQKFLPGCIWGCHGLAQVNACAMLPL